MDAKFKPFSDRIYRILMNVFWLFQAFWIFGKYSDYIYSNSAVYFCTAMVIVIMIPACLIIWDVRQLRQSKLHFKTDLKTKRMTYAELGTAITAFTFFGIGAYALSIFDPSNPALSQLDINKRRILHPYQFFSFELILLAFLFYAITLALFYAFLPKQIAEEPQAESSIVTTF